MASIIRRKDNNVVTYYFTNLVDINNIDLESSPANISLNGGARPLKVADINTTTHEVVHDVPAIHTWYGGFTKYDNTDGWSVLTDELNKMNSLGGFDIKVYLTQEDYDADQE
jgi:alanine-alpha-ketoisovalerate/valine-pyruvate aminotransferase